MPRFYLARSSFLAPSRFCVDACDFLVLRYDRPSDFAVNRLPLPAHSVHLRRFSETASTALALVNMITMPATASAADMRYARVLTKRWRSF